MLSLARFRSAFGVMSAYRDVATVVTGSMRVPDHDRVKVSNLGDRTFLNHPFTFNEHNLQYMSSFSKT
ncbi:Uncharacterized protein TCM_019212 [Theobroma cacao]|uniref:Uncharacterized protein n=1 Tax=Theobroma cacao TaxID=3641 RepID=A0A061EG36_THECC|nr:Uncharacterized protein TCM_019212 [Theobroma cacao]